MSVSGIDIRIPTAKGVTLTDDMLILDLSNGRGISVPLEWFPRLANGSPVQRLNWRFIGEGEGIHWPDLDEDISVKSLVAQRRSGEVASPDQEWSLRGLFPRFFALIERIPDPIARETVRRDLESRLRKSPLLREALVPWESDLGSLDKPSFEFLANEARHLFRRDPIGRGYRELFDILVHARAYRYLIADGCSDVRFLPQSRRKTPDLEAIHGSDRVLCEVKTLNVSNDEIAARRDRTVRKVSEDLDNKFFVKLRLTLAKAQKQLSAYAGGNAARCLIYVNICLDDAFGYYREDYRRQIDQDLAANQIPGVDVVACFDRLPFAG